MRLAERDVGPTGKVNSFESLPVNCTVLVRNLRDSKYANVVPVHAALSDESGQAQLYVSPGHSNHSLNPGYTDYQDTINVPAMSADDYLNILVNPRVDFVKMDVEGSEIRVSKGMERTIAHSPKEISLDGVLVNPYRNQSNETRNFICRKLDKGKKSH